MISAVTAAIAESLGAPPSSIRVVVTEVPMTHWATGDVTLAEKQEQDVAAAAGKAGS
jgi:4-oxalocrotonate tautomerase